MTRLALAVICLIFLLAGVALIPWLGIHNDEALFGFAVFQPISVVYLAHVGHYVAPLMLMTYVGALKGWIYRPIFAVFGTTVWSVRLPMVLAGVGSLWLFYLLLRRLSGARAALIGCALLAADTSYLLTTCFDWGPVALQHLLLIGGLLLVVKFQQEHSHMALAAGFFLFGLALWDKASAVWSLTGYGVAALATVPRELMRACRIGSFSIAVGAFAIGSLPLIAYNVETRGQTFRDTLSPEVAGILPKARVLQRTMDGSLLFGFLTADEPISPGRGRPAPAGVGSARSNLMLIAFGSALLLAPLAAPKDRRTMAFALMAMAVSWTQMAFTANAGSSAHHAILLWPLPEMVVGVAFAAASRRFARIGDVAIAAVVALVMASGLAVIHQYRVLMIRDGGGINWTDAIYTLSDRMKNIRASQVFCVDWGIMGSLHLLNQGKLPLRVGYEELSKPQWDAADRERLLAIISRPDHAFVAHTPAFEVFRGFDARLTAFADKLGYRRQPIDVIPDSHGRPALEVYRFVAGAE